MYPNEWVRGGTVGGAGQQSVINVTMTEPVNASDTEPRICLLPEELEILEDPRTASLKRVCYGIVLPAICCLGIIGNILNLVVLTRRNMRGTAYIYMRGESPDNN